MVLQDRYRDAIAAVRHSGGRLRGDLPSRHSLRLAEKKQLLDALKAVRSVADPGLRGFVVTELRQVYGPAFDLGSSGYINVDILAILNACLSVGGGLDTLVEILNLLGEDGAQAQAFGRLVRDLAPSPTLDPSQWYRLASLLSDVPLRVVLPLLRNPLVSEYVGSRADDAADALEAARRVDDFGRVSAGPAPLLVFLELLAHTLAGSRQIELHDLIRDVADQTDRVDEIRRVCHEVGETDTGGVVIEVSRDPLGANTRPIVTSRPTYARPTVWGGVPPRNVNFTGRSDLVDKIHEYLQQRFMPTALVQSALFGLGGVGKTQIAIEYAHRFQNDYNLVWWIPADDELSVRRSFVALGRRLGLSEHVNADDNVDAALDALRIDPEYSHWLLVFDNANDPRLVRRYLPSGSGHVLITSRSSEWAVEANAIEVGVFAEDESVQLLTRRWPILAPDKALTLAQHLGHLPLALDQAAAFCNQTGMPVERYLEMLEAGPSRLLGVDTAFEYGTSVAQTFQLAFDQLRERSPAAAQLLQLCAFISSHPIAISMLARGRATALPSPLDAVLGDDIELRRAVRELGRLALAQLDTGRDFITVHTLVRAVIREAASDAERWTLEQSAHEVLALANPGQPDQPDTWSQHAQIAQHVLPSGIIYSPSAGARRVVLDQIRYLYQIGDFSESRSLGQLVVEVWRGSLGPDDAMTLIALDHLANTLRAMGEYAQARAIDQDTLERFRHTLGDDHDYTLGSARSIAADMRLSGAFDQARALDEDTLERHRRVLGDDDPSTLRTAHNLAADYRLLGDSRRALSIDQDTLERRERVFGEDHPETLQSYASIARDLFDLGQYVESLELQREKLAIYERLLSADHVDILYARRNMAIALRKAGSYSQGLAWATEVYEVYRRRFGRRHEHTLAATSTLCNTLCAVATDPATTAEIEGATLDRARDLGDEALATYREVFGMEHPFTLASASNLGIVLRALHLHDEAAELDERTVVSLERVLGQDHPFTLCCTSNLTNNLASSGDITKAVRLAEDVLNRSRRIRIEDHPYTLAVAANLALDLAANGRIEEATVLRADTRSRFRRRLGPNHPETLHMERELRSESDIELPAT